VLLRAEADQEEGSGSQKFQEITTEVPQDVTEIYLPPDCPSSGSHYPNTMFTILPSSEDDGDDGDKVRIETYPADLVSATTKSGGNSLRLKWNDDVASNANEGGVKIYFPPSRLYDVSTAADAKVQILDGFTSMENIKVSSDSKLYATLNSLSDDASLTMSISSDAEVQIVSNGNFNHVSVSSDAKVSLEALVVEHFKVSSDGEAEIKGNVGFADISSDAKLTIDGNLTDGGETSSDSKLTVYGSVQGRIRASSDSKVYVGKHLDGNVDASSDAQVRAPNCDTVSTSSDAKCVVDDSIDGSVDVDVEVLPFTLTGRQRCWWGNGGFTLSNMSGWQAGVLAIIIIAIVTCCGFGIWKCCVSRRNNNIEREAGAATTEYNVTYPGITKIPPPIPVKANDDNDDDVEAKYNGTGTAEEEDPSAIAYKVDDDDDDKQQQEGSTTAVPAEAIAVVEHVHHTADSKV